jgi:DNA relaxase NicK
VLTVQKTQIDWLRFRAKAEPREIFEALKPAFPQHAEFFNLKHQPKGMLGFKSAALICADDFVIGRMDFGGESQKGWVRVDIPGKGCAWLETDAVQTIAELPQSQIRRLDVALTTWHGEVGHQMVVDCHAAGFFNKTNQPNLQQILNTHGGRTCYVGKREKSDKFFRGYEKGHELVSKLAASMRENVTHLEGVPVGDIYRCEVEFKAIETDIPWDVIRTRDEYFAGAYPFCSSVLPNANPAALKRRPEEDIQADLASALENCRIQYGPTIFTALMAYGGDMTAVWDKIIGDHHSQPLIDAGVLLVDHD